MLFDISAYAIDIIQPIVKWLSIGLVATIFAVGIVFAIVSKKRLARYIKTALLILTVYALVVGITLLVADVIKHYDPDYLAENYINADVAAFVLLPLIVTLTLLLIGLVVTLIVGRYNNQKFKLALWISGVVVAVAVAATLVLMLIYFLNNISGDGYYTDDGAGFDQLALYVSASALMLGAVAAAIFFDRNSPPFSAKLIARAGICIALSFALSYIKLFKLPQGGAVTLASSLPIILFALSYGPKKGLIVGFIYGLLQAVQDPFIIHPAQFMLDYPIAFTMLGFAGAFIRTRLKIYFKFTLGALLAVTLRYLSHVLSGVFAFGAYAVDAGADNLILYSMAYNSFVFVDMAIAVAVGTIIMLNKSFRKAVLDNAA